MIKNLKNRIFFRDVMVTVKIMSPLAAVVGLGLYFDHFVLNAMKEDIAIAGFIMISALYGALLIFLRLRTAQEDFYIIERFGREASMGVPMNQLLEEPWIRRRYIRHYLKHIANTEGALTSQLDQNAIESELHALQEDYNSKLEFPQFLVGFMIAMGLLGTFIGLLETLTGISGMLASMSDSTASPEEQFKELVSELRKPLGGMGIAFSASMFGLITSLMLAVMMTNLRNYISKVVMCARNVMHDLTQISRKSNSISALTIEGKDDLHIKPSVGGSDPGSMLIASRMDMLLKKLEILFKSFETSIAGTSRLNDLLGFGPRMKETAERTLEELRVIANASLEQQRMMQQGYDAQMTMVTSTNAILDTQRRSHNELSSAIKSLNERLSSVEQATIGTGRHLWEIKENFTNFSALYGMIEMMSSNVGHQTMLFEALVAEARALKEKFDAPADPYAAPYDPNQGQ